MEKPLALAIGFYLRTQDRHRKRCPRAL